MATSFRPYAPDQEMLLPPSLREWLPEGHLAYFISDTIDALDLSTFFARYANGGPRNQPFNPVMMVKVLVYSYATGVFSSRKIERRLQEDVAFRLLAAGNFPRHRTIRDFRAQHLDELSALFVQVVKVAQELGLVKLGTVAIDGTKVKANAGRHKAMSYARMQQAETELKAQIDELLERAKRTDANEADEADLDLPAEIARRENRLKEITAARERLEQRQREADTARGRSEDDDRLPRGPDGKPKGGRYKRDFGEPKPKAQENFTDPDSRIMKRTGGGFDQSYNAQTAVDDTAQIIVAAELSNNAADSAQLLPMLNAINDVLGSVPGQTLADADYRSDQTFEQAQDNEAELVVALGREGKQQAGVDADRYPHTTAIADRLQSQGQAAYRRRKWIAEVPNGWIKNVLGFRQFSLRGLAKVQVEWKLVCLALNLRRMSTLCTA